MAKHPHKLMLHQKKTWKCMLPGCRSFWHVGLQYTLLSQIAECWECHDQFMVDERALEDDQPICDTCRARSTGIDMDGIESYAKLQIALAKAGVKSVDELTPVQRSTMIALGILPNEIEVDEPE